ncbi:MAG: glycosyltransferase family 9 protein [Planctomycetes bacterium]|nr:glycosyltransferase family 9 protein [Planctomycetota bacterium]
MSALLAPGELVVVRLPTWLGDAVMAEPVLHALAARQRLRVLAPAKLLDLFPSLPDDTERRPLTADAPERARDYAGARAALLLNGSFRSAFLACAAGVPLRAGFASGGRRFVLTHALGGAKERGGLVPGRGAFGRGARALPRPFTLACRELAGLAGLAIERTAPHLVPNPEAIERVRARRAELGLDAPFLLVHAGARPGSAKGVPPVQLARLTAIVARELGLAPVLCCGPGEEDAARATRAALWSPAVLLDAPAPGVAELVAWSASAAFVLGPDNGARHVAQALGKRTLVLCGPTDPRHTDEHERTTRVVRVPVECGPCHRERCSRASDVLACFTRLPDADVLAAARALARLETPSGSSSIEPLARS